MFPGALLLPVFGNLLVTFGVNSLAFLFFGFAFGNYLLLSNLFIFCAVMPQPVYINDPGAISNTEDLEEDLETPTGENLFFSAKVGNTVF